MKGVVNDKWGISTISINQTSFCEEGFFEKIVVVVTIQLLKHYTSPHIDL